ncbi:MAG: hypothetical protein Q8N84_04315, partial [bacterium]|nr:hypothetical protein [bacterium]
MRNRKLEWEVVAAIALLLAMVWPSATLAADPSASLSNPLQVTLTTRVVAGQGLEIKHMVRNVGPADLPTVWLQGEWWRPVEGGSPPPPPTYVWDVGPLAAGAERTLTQLAPCGVTIYARARVVAYSDGGKFTGDAGMQGPFWVACSGGSATCWEAPWLCPGQDEPTLPANYTGLKLEASGVRAGQGYVALEILTGAGWDHRGVAALTHHEVR